MKSFLPLALALFWLGLSSSLADAQSFSSLPVKSHHHSHGHHHEGHKKQHKGSFNVANKQKQDSLTDMEIIDHDVEIFDPHKAVKPFGSHSNIEPLDDHLHKNVNKIHDSSHQTNKIPNDNTNAINIDLNSSQGVLSKPSKPQTGISHPFFNRPTAPQPSFGHGHSHSHSHDHSNDHSHDHEHEHKHGHQHSSPATDSFFHNPHAIPHHQGTPTNARVFHGHSQDHSHDPHGHSHGHQHSTPVTHAIPHHEVNVPPHTNGFRKFTFMTTPQNLANLITPNDPRLHQHFTRNPFFGQQGPGFGPHSLGPHDFGSTSHGHQHPSSITNTFFPNPHAIPHPRRGFHGPPTVPNQGPTDGHSHGHSHEPSHGHSHGPSHGHSHGPSHGHSHGQATSQDQFVPFLVLYLRKPCTTGLHGHQERGAGPGEITFHCH